MNILAIPVLKVEANTEDGKENAQCSQGVVDYCQWKGNPVDHDSDRWMFITCSNISCKYAFLIGSR